MLDRVFASFIRLGSAGLRNLLKAEAELRLGRIETLRYGEYLDGLTQPAQLFGFRAEGWGGEGLVAVGPGSAYLILDRLLGAARAPARPRTAPKPATALETGILRQIVTFLLGEAERAFSEIAPVSFKVERAETNLRAIEIAKPGEAVLLATIIVDIDGAAGEIDLVLPSATLEPIRHLLVGRFVGEKLGRDDLWSAHLATEIWQAEIEAEAVLHQTRMSLGRVLDLAVGDTLMLEVKPSDLVEVRSGALVLTRGRIGRVDGRIAVQVAEAIRGSRSVDPNFGRPQA
jgi:flagellar motor switch protein FliM